MAGRIYDDSLVSPPMANRNGLKAAQQALELLRATPDPPRNLLLQTLVEIGDWHQTMSRPAMALPYYTEAAMLAAGPDPEVGNPLLAPAVGDPLQYLNSEASGVDLNFKVGITTDTRGDLQLGLAFSRILDAGYDGLYAPGAQAFSWTLAEPFNSARMTLGWSKGAFSTGVQGYYRDSVDFLNRDGLDALTTFDVHFTWRTPWKANLSVGASNVLNGGSESSLGNESQPVDPLESIYGRIPYVRYKQDL